MFSLKEKKRIATAIEKILLDIDHPEMPKEKPVFIVHVEGKDPSWSWANIKPNWIFNAGKEPGINQWNEKAHEIMGGK